MFFFNFSIVWSFTYFFFFIYALLVFSFILYLIPSVKDLMSYSVIKNKHGFEYVTGFDLYWIFLSFLFLILLNNFSWSSYPVSAWFGNFFFSIFQLKFSYFTTFLFFLVISVYSTTFYFSSKQVYDFVILLFNFFFWTFFLFSTNNLFTFIFFIEILSTLIFLLLINSTFSSTYFYNNLDLNANNYFSNNMPVFYLQTLMYFFWISLITSLNLFLFLVLFYLKFSTLDWFFIEFIFFHLTTTNETKDLFFIFFIWFNFLFSIFLKCGLVPFYFWKPIFFKGMTIHLLFFYIFYFYFFLFLFILKLLILSLNEVFFFFIFTNLLLLAVGFVFLLFILCEAYYLKAFFALSSILNTLFVFLALNANCSLGLVFFF